MQGVSCLCVPLGFVLLRGSGGTPVLGRAHMGWDVLLLASGMGTWPLPPTPLPRWPWAREKKTGTRRECVWKMPGFIRQADVQADSFIQMHSITGSYTGLCLRCVSSCECLSSTRSGKMLAARDAGTGAAGGGPGPAPASDPPRCHRSCVGRRGGEGSPAQCARKGAGHVRGAPSGTLVPVLCTGLQAVEERARGRKWERRQ